MSPDDFATAARARVGRLEAVLEVLGSDSPEAQLLIESSVEEGSGTNSSVSHCGEDAFP